MKMLNKSSIIFLQIKSLKKIKTKLTRLDTGKDRRARLVISQSDFKFRCLRTPPRRWKVRVIKFLTLFLDSLLKKNISYVHFFLPYLHV